MITIGVPRNTSLLRIERDEINNKWRLWTATKDYKHGTYLVLTDAGEVYNVTEHPVDGPDIFQVKPKD